MKQSKTLSDLISPVEELRIKQKLKGAVEAKKVVKNRQLFLPGMEDFLRAMPNHLARSSLFAPVAPGRKKNHNQAILVSRADAVITYSGIQLDEAQADVWMHAMYEARKLPLGEPVVLNRATFLKAIGRSSQGENYKWLQRAMDDLMTGLLKIKVKKSDNTEFDVENLRMVEDYKYVAANQTYMLWIDSGWYEVYGNQEFALIDWEKRLQFGMHQNMAKALQRLLAASSNQTQYFPMDWLKSKMEYSSPMRKFKEAIDKAMVPLKGLKIVSNYKFKTNTKGVEQLTVWLGEAE